jgi:hypothetical protein
MDVTVRTALENANAAFFRLHVLLSSAGVPDSAKNENWDTLWEDVNAVNAILMSDDFHGQSVQVVRKLYDATAWFLVESIYSTAQSALQPVLDFDDDFLLGLWRRLYDREYDARLQYRPLHKYSVKAIKKASAEVVSALEILDDYTQEHPNFQAADRQTIAAVDVVADKLDFISAALSEDRAQNRPLYAAQGYVIGWFTDAAALCHVYSEFIDAWSDSFWVPPPTARGAVSILAQINDAINP